MRKISILLTFGLLQSLCLSLNAQNISVSVNPDVVIEGERFKVVYELENANADDINIDEIEGCKKLSGPGVSSSTSISIINGKRTSKSSHVYTYLYKAEKAGTYTIQPATFTIGGKQIKSRQASIKILPPDQDSSTSSSNNFGSSTGQNQDNVLKQSPTSQRYIRFRLNKSKAYEHEAIECTLILYSTTQVDNLNYKTPASFDGFLTVDDSGFRSQPTMDNIDGRNYIIYPLKRYIIFPQKTGKLEIQPGQLTMTEQEYEEYYDPFFGRQRFPIGQHEVTISGTNSTIEVMPLPHPQPASFNGAVGRFTLEAHLNSTELRTNEAATLKTILSGTGNIGNIKSPAPEFPIDFEQYSPAENISTRVSGNTVTGMITTEYTFVPQSVGDFELPKIEFSYFDTSKKEYITLTAGGYDVKVSRGAGVTTGFIEQEEIKARITDILHIHPVKAENLSKKTMTPIIYKSIFWIIWGIVIAIATLFLIFYRKQIKRRSDVVGMKTSRAGRVAKKRLRRAKHYMEAGNSDAFHAEVLKAMWGYISDRLNIPVVDLNRANISEKLTARDMSETDINDVINLLDECEMARYTPASAMRAMPLIYQNASDLMDILSKITRK